MCKVTTVSMWGVIPQRTYLSSFVTNCSSAKLEASFTPQRAFTKKPWTTIIGVEKAENEPRKILIVSFPPRSRPPTHAHTPCQIHSFALLLSLDGLGVRLRSGLHGRLDLRRQLALCVIKNQILTEKRRLHATTVNRLKKTLSSPLRHHRGTCGVNCRRCISAREYSCSAASSAPWPSATASG